jgi:hypothetical protein
VERPTIFSLFSVGDLPAAQRNPIPDFVRCESPSPLATGTLSDNEQITAEREHDARLIVAVPGDHVPVRFANESLACTPLRIHP